VGNTSLGWSVSSSYALSINTNGGSATRIDVDSTHYNKFGGRWVYLYFLSSENTHLACRVLQQAYSI